MLWHFLLAVSAILTETHRVNCQSSEEDLRVEVLGLATLPSNFVSLRLNTADRALYVDKSLLIRDIILHIYEHTLLIIKPPQFGKTVNMNMLERFYKLPDNEQEGALNRRLFLGGDVEVDGVTKTLGKLKIADYKDIIHRELGRYPVINLSFKNCTFTDVFTAMDWVNEKIVEFFNQRKYLERYLRENKIEIHFENTTRSGLNLKPSYLRYLIDYMYKFYNKRVVVLIDDFDYAILHAFLSYGGTSCGFKRILAFFVELVSYTFPENEQIEKAVLASIVPYYRNSGGVELNWYSMLEWNNSECFGFTKSEVDTLLAKFPSHRTRNENFIKTYYGGVQLYNPRSVLECLENEGALRPNMGNDEYLKVFDHIPIDSTIVGELDHFVRNELGINIDSRNSPSWYDLNNGVFGYLIYTGYLSMQSTKQPRLWHVTTNLATKISLERRIVEWIMTKLKINKTDNRNDLQHHLLQIELYDFTKLAQDILRKATVSRLYSGAQLYYMEMLEGLITHNMAYHRMYRASHPDPEHRVDIVFAHKSEKGCVLGVIMTIHAVQPNHTDTLKTIAEQGLQKLSTMGYETKLYQINPDVQYVLKLSLTFSGHLVGMRCHIEKTKLRGPGTCDAIRVDSFDSTKHPEINITTTPEAVAQESESTETTSYKTARSSKTASRTTLSPEINTFKIFIKSKLPATNEVPLRNLEKHLQSSKQKKTVFKQFLSSKVVMDDFDETINSMRAAIIDSKIKIPPRSLLRKQGFRVKYKHIIEAVVETIQHLYTDDQHSNALETVEKAFDSLYKDSQSGSDLNAKKPLESDEERKSSAADSSSSLKYDTKDSESAFSYSANSEDDSPYSCEDTDWKNDQDNSW